jgi:DNA processing protein
VELTTVGRRDEAYPPLLAQLHDPPRRLYVRGSVDALGEPAVAIVGARSCSAYGSHVARSLARELGAAGVVVVSGLARGIDGEAHRGALEAGGPTVAVLGCGIDRDYPRAHAGLAERIGANGAVITADFALELGREVFAVPGEITAALSAGTNDLLRQGAAPLLSARDVLNALGLEPPERPPPPVSGAAASVLRLLSDSACDFDGLVRASGRSSAEVAAALVELELAGLVDEADGIYRCRLSAGSARALPQPA